MTDPNPVDPPDTEPDDTDQPEQDKPADDGYTPPSAEEWERTRAALRKANREAANLRAKAKAAPSPPAPEDKPAADPDAKVKRQAGLTALVEQGLSREQAKVAIRLIDLSAVTVDEDGDPDGLDDLVADLKEQFPGMFPTKDNGRVTDGDRRRPNTSPKDRLTSAPRPARDKTSERLLRQGNYL